MEGFEVREQVFEQKCPDGDDAKQRVQFVPDETGALPCA
jgi:hypothetical protein